MFRRIRIISFLSFAFAYLLISPTLAKASPATVPAPEVVVQVEGRELKQPVPPVIAENRLLIGIRAVGEAIGGTVEWNAESRQVTVLRQTDRLVLTIGRQDALLNGKPVPMEVPPLIYENRTMVPLRFIAEAFGGSVHWDGSTRTANILRKPSQVVAVNYVNVAGHATLKLKLTEPLLAVNPQLNGNRLALDLYPAVVGDLRPAQPTGDALVRRFSLTQGWRQVRLEVELTQLPAYRYSISPDGLELTLEFDHIVTGAAFQQDGRIAAVQIEATGQLNYTTMKLTNPDRFVVDVAGARLAPGAPSSLPVGRGFLERVRLSQYQPDKVRVVLDMTAGVPAQILNTERGLQVRFVPQLTGVMFEKGPEKSRLTIAGTLPMDAAVLAVPEKKQIIISIPQGVSGLKENLIRIADGAIDTVTVTPGGNGTGSLITLQLRYYLGHTLLSKNGDSSVSLDLATSPVFGRRIWIDAGHGQVPGGRDDPGTIGKVYKVYEKDVNLKIALELQKLLQAAGAQVFMTRTGNEGVDFTQRPALVNAQKPAVDLFISIHHNSAASLTARGTETYYWTTNPKSKRAAELIHPEVVKALGFPDRRVRTDSFYVIKQTLAPSILIEMGYLSSAEEEKAIADPEYPVRAANGIKNGLFRFFWQEVQVAIAN